MLLDPIAPQNDTTAGELDPKLELDDAVDDVKTLLLEDEATDGKRLELESLRKYHGTKRDGEGIVDGGYGEPQDEEELAAGSKRLDLNGEFSDGKRLELDDELEEICAR